MPPNTSKDARQRAETHLLADIAGGMPPVDSLTALALAIEAKAHGAFITAPTELQQVCFGRQVTTT